MKNICTLKNRCEDGDEEDEGEEALINPKNIQHLGCYVTEDQLCCCFNLSKWLCLTNDYERVD